METVHTTFRGQEAKPVKASGPTKAQKKKMSPQGFSITLTDKERTTHGRYYEHLKQMLAKAKRSIQ
jgi:CTP-dependent riboflavin kinase